MILAAKTCMYDLHFHDQSFSGSKVPAEYFPRKMTLACGVGRYTAWGNSCMLVFSRRHVKCVQQSVCVRVCVCVPARVHACARSSPCAGPRNRPKSGCCGPAEATYKLFSRQWRKKKVTSGSFPLSCGLSWHNATIFLIKLSL